MKNHFYISYFGNKRNEVEEIYQILDLTNIKTVVEPYCGSCAMSYYIWTKHPNLKFVLNDNNKYLKEMFNIIKDDKLLKEFEKQINEIIIPTLKNKVSYDKIIKEKTIFGWFIANKYYNIRPGLYKTNGQYKPINIKETLIFNFFNKANIEFYSIDAIELYEQYSNDPTNLLLLDPPYISTCNDFYINHNMNIYEYLYINKITDRKAHIYLILEDIWIIKLLFHGLYIKSYDKKYETSKKSTKHIIIYNKK